MVRGFGSFRLYCGNKDVGSALRALAQPLLIHPTPLAQLNQWRWVAHGKGYGEQDIDNSDPKVVSRFCCQKRLYGTCACGMK